MVAVLAQLSSLYLFSHSACDAVNARTIYQPSWDDSSATSAALSVSHHNFAGRTGSRRSSRHTMTCCCPLTPRPATRNAASVPAPARARRQARPSVSVHVARSCSALPSRARLRATGAARTPARRDRRRPASPGRRPPPWCPASRRPRQGTTAAVCGDPCPWS